MAEGDKALELESRRQLFELIQNNPGMHFREICRRVDMSPSVVDYHLRYMEVREIIVVKKEGRYSRYYPYEGMDVRDKPIMGLIQNPVLRGIIIHVLIHPGSTHKDILRAQSISPSTLSFHLSKLEKAGLIRKEKAGRKRRYYVIDEERIASLLITYRESLADALVDSFVTLWEEMHP